MSRLRKSRSLKRVTGGVKTGSKERTKLENKQRKAKQKAANPVKSNRQRSVYQRYLDENQLVEKQHVTATKAVKAVAAKIEDIQRPIYQAEEDSESLWDQLEKPTNNDTF